MKLDIICVWAPLDVNGKCAWTHAKDKWEGGDKRGREEVACMLKDRGLFVVNSPFDGVWVVEDEAILTSITKDL